MSLRLLDGVGRGIGRTGPGKNVRVSICLLSPPQLPGPPLRVKGRKGHLTAAAPPCPSPQLQGCLPQGSDYLMQLEPTTSRHAPQLAPTQCGPSLARSPVGTQSEGEMQQMQCACLCTHMHTSSVKHIRRIHTYNHEHTVPRHIHIPGRVSPGRIYARTHTGKRPDWGWGWWGGEATGCRDGGSTGGGRLRERAALHNTITVCCYSNSAPKS